MVARGRASRRPARASIVLVSGLLLLSLSSVGAVARPIHLFNGASSLVCSGNPQITITPAPNNGTAPLPVRFTSNITGGCPSYEVEWEFGDGAEASGLNVSHTYLGAGHFYVRADVTDANGLTASGNTTVSVLGGSGNPVVQVSVLPANGPAPLSVQAWANVTGGNVSDALNITWTFGDGGVGQGAFVSHVYVSPGNFTATATVHPPPGNPSGKGSARVHVLSGSGGGTVLSITASPQIVDVPGNVTLTATLASTGGPFHLTVCFGDGTACLPVASAWNGSVPQVLSHRYVAAGNYSIGGILTTTPGTVVAGASAIVIALAAPPLSINATVAPPVAPALSDVTFVATVMGGTPPYSIAWTFDDGAVGSSISGVPVVHTYPHGGTFFPWVIVTDAGGNVVSATLSAVTIHPGVSSGALPPTTLGVPTYGILLLLLLATLVVGIAYGRWHRRRLRMRRLRKEGEEIVRELEEGP